MADSPHPRFRIHVFPDSERFGRRLARDMGLPAAGVALHAFPDGESLVRVRLPPGRHAVLVRSLHQPNGKLVETVLAADALRRSGARRVTLIAPYLPYMRQDAVFLPGEPISQCVVGDCLGRAFDAVITVEAHLHRVRRLHERVPRGRSLSVAPAIAQWLHRQRRPAVVVGPDEESEPWVRAVAREARMPWAVGRKQRQGDRTVEVEVGEFAGATRAVIVDDIASSGGTLAATARALRRHGVATLEAIVVHAIFARGALARVRAAGVRRVVSCDTIPHPTNAITVAPVIAAALRAEAG